MSFAGDAVQVQAVLEHAAEAERQGDDSLTLSELLETREHRSRTPLHCAAKDGHVEAKGHVGMSWNDVDYSAI